MAKDKREAKAVKVRNGVHVDSEKKKLKRRGTSDKPSSINNALYGSEHSLGVLKDKKFKKGSKGKKKDALKVKKKKIDNGTSAELNELDISTDTVHELEDLRDKKSKKGSKGKKSETLKVKKKKLVDNETSDESNQGGISTDTVHELEDLRGGLDTEALTKNTKETSKKKKKKKIKKSEGDDTYMLEKEGTLNKADTEDIYEIQSVDEDCSRGMKKWLIKYNESRQDLETLQNNIDEFMTSYEEQKEEERKEREAQAAEGGWTVVVHHKGRKKTTEAETGVTMGSVTQAAVMDNVAKKKPKEVPVDFYRFQKREAQRNEVMLLQSKFEQDKKRIQQLRAARKFRPY